MANIEHLDILKQGVKVWNEWLKKPSGVFPDLYDSDLSGADFSNANFVRADLSFANLSAADLSQADLTDANLSQSDLSGANLSGTSLFDANLSGANLDGTVFTDAIIGMTTFANVDLSTANGLDSIDHVGPSPVGVDTIYKSKGNIPVVFLRGCGIPD